MLKWKIRPFSFYYLLLGFICSTILSLHTRTESSTRCGKTFFFFRSLNWKYLVKSIFPPAGQNGFMPKLMFLHFGWWALVLLRLLYSSWLWCHTCRLADFVGLNLMMQLCLCRIFNCRKIMHMALQLCQVRYFLPTIVCVMENMWSILGNLQTC